MGLLDDFKAVLNKILTISNISGTPGRVEIEVDECEVTFDVGSQVVAATGSNPIGYVPKITGPNTYSWQPDISGGSGSSGPLMNIDTGYYSPVQYPKWRVALEAVKIGTAHSRLACIGDSTTTGYPDRGTVSYPAYLRKLLIKAGIPSAEGFILPTDVAESRWTPGSDWAPTPGAVGPGLGGQYDYTAANGTSDLNFVPGFKFDTLAVFYKKDPSYGQLAVQVDGSTIGTIDCTTGSGFGIIAKHTFTGIALGALTVTFKAPGSTGKVVIVGLEAYNSNIKQVLVSNFGCSGAVTGGVAASSDLFKTYAPDLSIINLGVNDAINTSTLGGTLANFNGAIADLIAALSLSGDICLSTCILTKSGYSTNGLENEVLQNTSLKSIAIAGGLGFADLAARIVDHDIVPAFYGGDSVHFIPLGNSDIAQCYYDAIGKPNGYGIPSELTPGIYTNVDVTVDAKGKIVKISNGSAGTTVGGNSDDVFPNMSTAKSRVFWIVSMPSYGSASLAITPPGSILNQSSGIQSLGVWQLSSRFTTGANIEDFSGLTSSVVTCFNQKIKFLANVYTGASSNVRYWIGLSGGGEQANATPVNPSIMFGYDSGIDSTAFWRMVTCDGVNTTRIATAIPYTLNSCVQFAFDDTVPGIVTFKINGLDVGSITTNLPAAVNDFAAIQCTVTNLSTTPAVLEIKNIWIGSE